jgi:hypothetical protein
MDAGSSQGPQPSGPQPNDGNPSFDNNDDNVKDTDRLAHFLQTNLDNNNTIITNTGIKFLTQRSKIDGLFFNNYSRIARYIHKTYPGRIFKEKTPQYTQINDQLIQKVKDLNENVPDKFR